MCGQDNAPWCVWVLRRDDVGEVFGAKWCRVHECILFYVPIKLAQRRDEIIPDKGVVLGVGCTPINGLAKGKGDREKMICIRVLGIKIFWRWEKGSVGSRFLDGSRIFARSARAEEDREGKARSPREAAQRGRVA
jgi:hypothetical protein